MEILNKYMEHLQTYEAYIDDEGNLVQGHIDNEGQLQIPTGKDTDVEREYQIEDFNDALKEYLNKDYTFNITTQTYTWISNNENDKGKLSYNTKTYKLKKIIPNSYIQRKGEREQKIYFELRFVHGRIGNKERLKINFDKTNPIEIADLKNVGWTKWSDYSIHRNGEYDKKKTFPRKNWHLEYTVADYPTHEKLKELQNLIIEIEKTLNEDEKN